MKEENVCKIVQDLLPNYIENLITEERKVETLEEAKKAAINFMKYLS